MNKNEMLNKIYVETRQGLQPNVHQMIQDTVAKVQANKSKLDSIIKSDLYSITEIRNQEAKIREANAAAIGDLKTKLAQIKASVIEKGKQQDIERGKKGDLEVANMLSVLGIASKSIGENELNEMYQDGYFNPMLKMAMEAVAAERRYKIHKPASAAFTQQKAFIDSVNSYLDDKKPIEINSNYEVIAGMMSVTKHEIIE